MLGECALRIALGKEMVLVTPASKTLGSFEGFFCAKLIRELWQIARGLP